MIEITDDTYKEMKVGGPLNGGIDVVNVNVGFLIKVPNFHLSETTL
jgi:hypothetical protein